MEMRFPLKRRAGKIRITFCSFCLCKKIIARLLITRGRIISSGLGLCLLRGAFRGKCHRCKPDNLVLPGSSLHEFISCSIEEGQTQRNFIFFKKKKDYRQNSAAGPLTEVTESEYEKGSQSRKGHNQQRPVIKELVY